MMSTATANGTNMTSATSLVMNIEKDITDSRSTFLGLHCGLYQWRSLK